MSEITINGKKVRTRNGEFLLAVARREGISVPPSASTMRWNPPGRAASA